MPTQLTTEERDYLSNRAPNMDSAISIILSRLLGRPINEVDQIASDVTQAVQDHYTVDDEPEAENATDTERTA